MFETPAAPPFDPPIARSASSRRSSFAWVAGSAVAITIATVAACGAEVSPSDGAGQVDAGFGDASTGGSGGAAGSGFGGASTGGTGAAGTSSGTAGTPTTSPVAEPSVSVGAVLRREVARRCLAADAGANAARCDAVASCAVDECPADVAACEASSKCLEFAECLWVSGCTDLDSCNQAAIDYPDECGDLADFLMGILELDAALGCAALAADRCEQHLDASYFDIGTLPTCSGPGDAGALEAPSGACSAGRALIECPSGDGVSACLSSDGLSCASDGGAVDPVSCSYAFCYADEYAVTCVSGSTPPDGCVEVGDARDATAYCCSCS